MSLFQQLVSASKCSSGESRRVGGQWSEEAKKQRAETMRRNRDERYKDVFQKLGPILSSQQIASYLCYNPTGMAANLKRLSEEPDPIVKCVGERRSSTGNGKPQHLWALTTNC